jgi:4-aminobutyrate aminotransferase-like enzyme
MLARQFHEPIHSQVLEHGSFDLLFLIDGKHVVRHDLRRGRPTLELVKSKRAEELGIRIRARLEQLAARNAAVGEVRGLGPMLALELTEPTPDLAKAVTSAARDRGLVLLSCGIYGNVIRILVPLTIDDALLERGLDLLEESLGDARAG